LHSETYTLARGKWAKGNRQRQHETPGGETNGASSQTVIEQPETEPQSGEFKPAVNNGNPTQWVVTKDSSRNPKKIEVIGNAEPVRRILHPPTFGGLGVF
jgi:hypothetical protein